MEVRKSPQESYSQPLEEEVDPDSVHIGIIKRQRPVILLHHDEAGQRTVVVLRVVCINMLMVNGWLIFINAILMWRLLSHPTPSSVVCCNAQQLRGNQEDPCKVKSKVVNDVQYCDRYWECVNDIPELYDCPNGLVFAGKHRGVTEGCDYPWRSNYCEGKELANGPISTENCDWLYGIFGHETSCTRYWTCWNGTATEQLCIGGLLYNENAHSCDWPENVEGCQKHRELEEV